MSVKDAKDARNRDFNTNCTFCELTSEAVAQRCSFRKVFLKISQNSQESTCAGGLRPATLLKKETLTQVFSCEFWKIFKNTFFYRTPLVDASVT